VYRSKYNFELDRKFNSSNVIGVVKSNRLRYAEHKGVEDQSQRALYRAILEGIRRKTEIQVSGWFEQR
jgi:hypothetical protein